MRGMRMVVGMLLVVGAAGLGCAQDTEKPAYQNPNLPAEQRAADLVHRMTLEEKASQLVNQARPIPRLGVKGYDWWSEALHGVAVVGTTEFPEPIGLASTFDTAKIHEMAIDIGTEARVIYEQSAAANDGNSLIFHGLDFWAPNLNIFRDPRWGRGQETYGEDPFLDRADGRGVCDRDARGRSALLPRDFNTEAFRRALGAGADAALCGRGCEQAR